MKLLSSLRSRIFLGTAMLIVLSIGATIYLVSVRVTREAENSMRREIAATGTLVDQFRHTRTETFTMMARLIADAPKLKAAVDTNDPPTVQDTADDYQAQVNSKVLLITNRTGQVLATIGGSPRIGDVVAHQPAVRNALSGHEGVSLLPQPDGILHLVTVPMAVGLSQPDILGTLSVGFLLDDAFAGQLKTLTGSDIAFGMDGQVLSSTLPRGDRDALSRILRQGPATASARLHGEEFAVLPMALSAGDLPDGGGPIALILRSRTEQLRFLSEIHTELAVTAVVAVLLGTLLSFTVARTITRPLAAITGVMRDVAATGDLTRKIVLRSNDRWDDEDAQLLASTFNTLTDSVARAQREMSQRERLSSLGRLSTVIAHEVRNPLMIIKAALHTLRRPAVNPDEVREVAADIDGEVARLNNVVNDVLDFARPIDFDLAPTDLNALCRDAAAAAQVTPGAAVTLDTDPAVGAILTDSERLRAALVNVIVNARHAVNGQQTQQVSLTTRRQDSAVLITVSDTGVGIERADLPRVFDPYFTTKRGGTGLGLPITKNVVEGLGGTIVAASEPGRGTEIRITLAVDPAGVSSSTLTDRPVS
ncbi:MAG TPA: ATP-binding protein [Vicinamibacterales bacterium]|nr:ATP-binding protein [Vicinamibacterales bacterium]